MARPISFCRHRNSCNACARWFHGQGSTLFASIACLGRMPNCVLRLFLAARKTKVIHSGKNDAVPHSPASVLISWTYLLKRVFEIDIEHCPQCGGNMKIIADIRERAAITKILNHLGLSSRAPPCSTAQVFDPFGSA